MSSSIEKNSLLFLIFSVKLVLLLLFFGVVVVCDFAHLLQFHVIASIFDRSLLEANSLFGP